jgi:hypothetical protein
MLGQGVPFFHAGSDMLRSKNFDRDSYNSGDWFNRLDFTYASNSWGGGLPVASKNQENWPLQQPFLADPANTPDQETILLTVNHFQDMLQIRHSSPLFRLQTAVDVMARLRFFNDGPEQIPGLIVMSLSDMTETDLDPNHEMIVVLFNANDEAQTFTLAEAAGVEMMLHPVLAANSHSLYTEMGFDAATGMFAVPGRSTAVFVLPEGAAETEEVVAETEVVAEAETAVETPTPETEEHSAEEHENSTEEHTEKEEPIVFSQETVSQAFSLWLGAAAVGFAFALLIALLSQRSSQTAHDEHSSEHHEEHH